MDLSTLAYWAATSEACQRGLVEFAVEAYHPALDRISDRECRHSPEAQTGPEASLLGAAHTNPPMHAFSADQLLRDTERLMGTRKTVTGSDSATEQATSFPAAC